MERPASKTLLAVRMASVLLFFAILFAPLSLMAIFGPDDTALNSESSVELTSLSFSSFVDGSFQSNFESWLSAKYPMRSDIVRGYRQMQYTLENSAAVITAMKFLNGQLFKTEPPKTQGSSGNNDITATLPEQLVTGDKFDELDKPSGSEDDNEVSSESSGTDDGNENEKEPEKEPEPVDPWAIYTDSSNIYSEINKLQLAQEIVEPVGWTHTNRVNIGKSGYLYESAYIDEYYGYTNPYASVTDEGLQENIKRLEYIQKELKKRDIEMLYIITPSKASQYTDYIPDWYKNSRVAPQNYVRPITRYRAMLAKSSINYLDSAAYFQKIGLLNTFPKTGIHWNAVAAFEATARLIRMYSLLSGDKVVELESTGYESSPTPYNRGNQEQDVYNILYGELTQATNRIVDSAYYVCSYKLKNTNSGRINVLMQGGSFEHAIEWNLKNYGVANVTKIYYNNFSNNSTSPWVSGPEVWGHWLTGKDLVIFEANEQQIRGGHASGNNWVSDSKNGNIGHNAIYDSLYTYLKNHEG